MTKRIISALLAIVMATAVALSFGGCAGKQGVPLTGETINVYNWGEYIANGDDGSMDVIAEFTKRTGIEVNYTTFASNEEMYAKISSGAADYDVIIPSEYMIEKKDKGRAEYYNFFTFGHWGKAAGYDLCIDSSILGIEGTADFIIDFGRKAGLI